jgi:hypothetical protein
MVQGTKQAQIWQSEIKVRRILSWKKKSNQQILQIFHIKTQLIKRTLCFYPLYWLPGHFRLILVNLKENNFGNFRGHFLKTCSVVSTIHSAL